MEEMAFMVCVRVEDLEVPHAESTQTACVECGSDVWISAASRKELGRLKAMPVCAQCAKRLAQEHPVSAVGTPSDDQFEEMIESMRDSGALKPEWEAALSDDEYTDTFDSLKAMASMAGEVMQNPDDDWGSIVVLESYDGFTFPPLPMDQLMRTGIPKDVIARQLLPGLVHASNARRVLFGFSTWTLAGQHPPEGMMISEHPDREEQLVLIDITADGVQQVAFARITRDGESGPELSDWEDSELPAGADGLFVEALVPALQLVRSLREGK